MLTKRYAGFADTEIGRRFASGAAGLAELAEHAKAMGATEAPPPSGKAEKFESIFNAYALGA